MELARALYELVLVPAFPPDELESWDTLRSCLLADHNEPGNAFATVLLDATDSAPIAGTVSYWYPQSRTWLLGYLAVDSRYRRRGVAPCLIADTVSRWAASDETLLGVAEMENPCCFPDEAAKSRARMYIRVHGRVLATDFVQPRVDPDKDRVSGMLLVCLYAAPEALVGDQSATVRSGLTHAFIAEYFQVAEGSGQPTETAS